MAPGEVLKARAVASVRPGSWRSVGGDLVLTNRRLVFTPLETRLGDMVSWLDHPPLGSQSGRLGGIADVEPGSRGWVLKPPTLVIISTTGARTEIGVLASRFAPNWSRRNRAERDRVVEAIRHALEAG
jgi:hypothetical protein